MNCVQILIFYVNNKNFQIAEMSSISFDARNAISNLKKTNLKSNPYDPNYFSDLSHSEKGQNRKGFLCKLKIP